MIEEKLIDKSSIKITLEEVSYNNIETSDTIDSVASLRTIDTYEVLSITDKYMELLFARKFCFTPKVLMEANVRMKIGLKLTDQKRDIKDADIRNELEERIDELLQLPISNSSFILSSITSVSMSMPLITPPFFLKKEDNDSQA